MAGNYALEVVGLKELGDSIPDEKKILEAASRAINETARKTRTKTAAMIKAQVNFPASYLQPGQKRLVVSRYASAKALEGKITARQRATSLARFVVGGVQPGKRGGVHVEVKPGSPRFLKNAFAIRLRRGSADVEEGVNNTGLAIRLKPGETIGNKKRQLTMIQQGKKSNLYLLYGPSVDQVFKTVREDVHGEVEKMLADEFTRQMELLS